jgi:hypothetical protein
MPSVSRRLAVLVPFAVAVACSGDAGGAIAPGPFDGERALALVRAQLDFGARVPGSDGHRRTGDWLVETLRPLADTVLEQTWTHVTAAGDSLPMRNILARFRPDAADRVFYVTHWDTRPISEKASDPAQQVLPVPGANDGGSGTAVLLHLAELLKATPPAVGVDLLFVDGEDYGDFGTDTDVLIGSKWFAQHPMVADHRPLFGVLWDMIGDADLVIRQEAYSVEGAPEVVTRVWETARRLGYGDVFVDESAGAITDDHVPLLRAGYRVIDVIDLDYPPHHTPDDTIDKVSARSLKVVGDVAWELIRALR